ncbi:MAG: DUF5348 domain-containing protein [Bacillales bacterium]|nr:DUF5348 domain-containing protein [Bacillales bacterium]
MKSGILAYNHFDHEWRVWIGQRAYWVDQGYTFEIRIQNKYFKAYLEKDNDWYVTIEKDIIFILHPYEMYKVRVNLEDCIAVDAPF